MKKFYTLFGLMLVCALPIFLFSCNESTVDPELFGSISGTVKTSVGGIPLEGVTITTSPGTESKTTDADGNFDIGDVPVGDYSVTAKKEDYSSENINISVRENKEVVMDIVMQIAPPDSEAPDEPIYSSPVDKKEDEQTTVKLVWNNGETEVGDTLRFDVILFEGSDDFEGTKVASNILDTTFTVTNLKFETSYEWKIIARNKSLDETEGRLWKFKTEDFPLNGYLFVKDSLDSRDIYSWDLQENHLIRLTNQGGSEVQPRISPNEKSIAYSSNASGVYQIYTMDTKGENVTQVTSQPIAGYHNDGVGYTWSPDGDQLLYGHYGDLYSINYNGTGESKIADAPVGRHFKQCDWSDHFNFSTQEKIAVLTQGEMPYDNEIYLMDPDGSNMFLLVDNLKGTLSSPHFSPDGSKLIFSLDSLYEDDNGRQLDAKIYSINVDGTNLTNLSGTNKTAGTNDLQARYSETGGKIIFMNVANDGEGVKSVWAMDIDGSNREKLIHNGEMPDWYNP